MRVNGGYRRERELGSGREEGSVRGKRGRGKNTIEHGRESKERERMEEKGEAQDKAKEEEDKTRSE